MVGTSGNKVRLKLKKEKTTAPNSPVSLGFAWFSFVIGFEFSSVFGNEEYQNARPGPCLLYQVLYTSKFGTASPETQSGPRDMTKHDPAN